MTDRDKRLIDGAASMGIELSGGQASLLGRHMDLVLEWNAKINLTAITDEEDFIAKHILDSLSLVKCAGLSELSGDCERSFSLIDVGSGSGFPGIPLKILFPRLRLTLLDSLGKRVNFLNEAIKTLLLEGVSVLNARAEEAGSDPAYRQRFDFCAARAVAPLGVLSEYCLPFVKSGGYFYAMKGPDAASELNAASSAINTLGGEVEGVAEISLPRAGITHTVVIIKKVRQTPPKYPRKQPQILKNPIKAPE